MLNVVRLASVVVRRPAAILVQKQAFKPIAWRRTICSAAAEPEVKAAETDNKEKEVLHNIIANTERQRGQAEVKQFQAETRKLLDIVAKSLYSSKEVFLRELISNSSDALEKLRYIQVSSPESVKDRTELEIHIATDDRKNQLIIQDTGLGMTREELVQNLGVIAHSGSQHFAKELEASKQGSDAVSKLIGQFGVGFYSAFMVADRVDVYSQSYKAGSQPFKWTSDGSGSYEIFEAEGVQRGTKIVLHLKKDCREYSKESIVSDIVRKYSNFVSCPVYLNGKKANIVQAVWLMNPREVSPDMHEAFYRFVSGSAGDKPQFTLHFQSDSPLNIRALFYVAESKPPLFELSRDTEVSVSLYSRRVLILQKANSILPRWLRFVKGVVDCEDIPLNLSRELLQDGILIRKLRETLTSKLLRFFLEQQRREPEKYANFYRDFGVFVKEGVVTSSEQELREDAAKLLLFESSALPPGQKTSLPDYVSRMKAGEKKIYYFGAPSRQLAESSPYFEAVRDSGTEVLFCLEPHDDLVLMQLMQFNNRQLASIENDLSQGTIKSEKAKKSDDATGPTQSAVELLSKADADSLTEWVKTVALGPKRIANVRMTDRLTSHPCAISVPEMAAARHLVRMLHDKSDEEKMLLLQPTLELNGKHPIVKKLFDLAIRHKDERAAKLLIDQLYNNAMIAAALLDDPRRLLGPMNELLTKLLEGYQPTASPLSAPVETQQPQQQAANTTNSSSTSASSTAGQ